MLDLSAFNTGTMGEAQSENWVGSSVPSATSRSNSLSTISFKEYGTVRAFENRGVAPSSTRILALKPFKVPNPSLKTAPCLCSVACKELV